MRRRLLVAMLALCSILLLLICLPLGLIARSLIEQDFDQRMQRNTDSVTAAIDAITSRGETVRQIDLARLVPDGRRAVYVPASGPRLAAGRVSGPLRSRTRTVAGGRLEFFAPVDVVNSRVNRVWLLIAGLGLAALGVAVAAAFWMARRLTGPLDRLARRAERFGAGDLRPTGERFEIPELQRLASVLDWSASQLGQILERERRRARDTSHQLRTPLTGISMRLEEIRERAADAATRGHAEAALQQVQRLTDLAESTLGQGDGTLPQARVSDAAATVRDLARDWRPMFERAGRTLSVALPEQLFVKAPSTPVGQAVSALLDNALVHGGGTVTITARTVGDFAVLELSDEGPGIDGALVPQVFERGVSGAGGTGLGLSLARSFVEESGGRLELVRPTPAKFAIYLLWAE